jgi:hypothetical protein
LPELRSVIDSRLCPGVEAVVDNSFQRSIEEGERVSELLIGGIYIKGILVLFIRGSLPSVVT